MNILFKLISKYLRNRKTRIIVNGEVRMVKGEILSYNQIVKLSGGNPKFRPSSYSISYQNSDGAREGVLSEGSYCIVSNGTIVNCYYSLNS